MLAIKQCEFVDIYYIFFDVEQNMGAEITNPLFRYKYNLLLAFIDRAKKKHFYQTTHML